VRSEDHDLQSIKKLPTTRLQQYLALKFIHSFIHSCFTHPAICQLLFYFAVTWVIPNIFIFQFFFHFVTLFYSCLLRFRIRSELLPGSQFNPPSAFTILFWTVQCNPKTFCRAALHCHHFSQAADRSTHLCSAWRSKTAFPSRTAMSSNLRILTPYKAWC
jgi:hypothetical protein